MLCSSFSALVQILLMEMPKSKLNFKLCVKTSTWYKNSHSLYDYESQKVSDNLFAFPLLSKTLCIYRKLGSLNAGTVVTLEYPAHDLPTDGSYQLLTKFEVKPAQNNKIAIRFITKQSEKMTSDNLLTQESASEICQNAEEPYLIVKNMKEGSGEPTGHLLEVGNVVKLGRVEYFVSEISVNEMIKSTKAKGLIGTSDLMHHKERPATEEGSCCKICMEETDTPDNFVCWPCKCLGSCGAVHIDCLKEWVKMKVRKEVVGGTLHYNFQRFQCEVCLHELPTAIESKGKIYQILPIEKPKGNYMILEGACEKMKCVMIIQNIPTRGIRLGRGHDCEIRIMDISVSREHAIIKYVHDRFVLFDNKSKFGTLVKYDNMQIVMSGRSLQGVQIGRTVVTFDLKKELPAEEEVPLTESFRKVSR